MKIDKSKLRKLANTKKLKTLLVVIMTFVSGPFLGSFAIPVIAITSILGSLYIRSSICNIPCPNCGKPYGLKNDAFNSFNLIVPDKCGCCHAKAE